MAAKSEGDDMIAYTAVYKIDADGVQMNELGIGDDI